VSASAGGRFWVMWIGPIPPLFIGGFWIIVVMGELLIPHQRKSEIRISKSETTLIND
jgi:hypothetical protein